jgi:DNA-binding transcriptional MerR regulator
MHPLPDSGPSLTVAAVARKLGVAPATLRTWDRRYGVGPSSHEPGAHRRYSPEDITRLERMRRLVMSGVAPSEAAKWALAGRDPGDREQSPETAKPRSGGGNVLSLPGARGEVRGLARAAQALDTQECHRILTEAMDEHGVIDAWDGIIAPVMSALGDKWSSTGRGVETEHALSASVQEVLGSWIQACAPSQPGRSVVLACVPGDQHSLPLWAVGGALAERGIAARILGPNLPEDALARVVTRLGPAAILLWSQREETADLQILANLPSTRPAPAVLVGGPGWPEMAFGRGVGRVVTLEDCVDRITRALGH